MKIFKPRKRVLNNPRWAEPPERRQRQLRERSARRLAAETRLLFARNEGTVCMRLRQAETTLKRSFPPIPQRIHLFPVGRNRQAEPLRELIKSSRLNRLSYLHTGTTSGHEQQCVHVHISRYEHNSCFASFYYVYFYHYKALFQALIIHSANNNSSSKVARVQEKLSRKKPPKYEVILHLLSLLNRFIQQRP